MWWPGLVATPQACSVQRHGVCSDCVYFSCLVSSHFFSCLALSTAPWTSDTCTVRMQQRQVSIYSVYSVESYSQIFSCNYVLWHFDTIVHGKIQTFQKYGYKYGRTVNDMRRVSLRQLFSATCTQFRMMNTTGTAGEYSRDHLYSYQPPKWASSIPQAPSLRLHVILLSAHASNIVSRDLLLNF